MAVQVPTRSLLKGWFLRMVIFQKKVFSNNMW